MSAQKTAFWLQIAEYLIFCTRDDKDVHNALLTARKMEITNTNTQKYTFFIFYILYTVLAMRKLDFSLWIISNRPLPHYFQKVFFRNNFSRIQYSPYFWQWKLPLDRVNMWARQFWHILKQSHSWWGIPRIPHTSIFGVEASLKGRVRKKAKMYKYLQERFAWRLPWL